MLDLLLLIRHKRSILIVSIIIFYIIFLSFLREQMNLGGFETWQCYTKIL